MRLIVKCLGVMMLILILSAAVISAQDDDTDIQVNRVVSDTINTDLNTGVARSVALLSPDGQQLAHLAGLTLCVYRTDNLSADPQCIELDDRISMDLTSLQWSPDGRYLAFSEDAFRLFVDSSIWLVDVQAGEASALTEPTFEPLSFSGEGSPDIDLSPGWLGDSLYFMRSAAAPTFTESPLLLYRFDDLESEPLEIGLMHAFGLGATTALAVSDELVVFNVSVGSDEADYGVWSWTMDDNPPQLLAPFNQRQVPFGLSFSPDGRQLLTVTPLMISPADATPENSPARIMDIETGETRLIDENQHVVHGAWSSDGSAFAYLVFSLPDTESNGLYITSEAGVPGELVLPGNFYSPSELSLQPLTWATNNTILIGDRDEAFTAVIVQLAEE